MSAQKIATKIVKYRVVKPGEKAESSTIARTRSGNSDAYTPPR